MASLISISATKNYGFPPSKAVFGGARVQSICGNNSKTMISTKKTKTMIVNVATNISGNIQSPLPKEVATDGKLVAWTSVQQERWEGELVVEGEIPKWLV